MNKVLAVGLGIVLAIVAIGLLVGGYTAAGLLVLAGSFAFDFLFVRALQQERGTPKP